MKEVRHTITGWTVEESRDYGTTFKPITNMVVAPSEFASRQDAQRWCFRLYDALNDLGIKTDGYLLRVVAPKARKSK